MMQLETDTIVAISTPPGRGGIGIVRLSGPGARAIAAPLCRLRKPLAAGQARFAEIVDDEGAVLDEAVVTLFAAPHSYTSEDVVEIATHGAPVLLDFLLRACLRRGARLAEPGEFTQRAFLSGRLDLTQAEAVNDLIGAQTLHQAKVAAAQLGGSVARTIAPVKARLVHLIAELEAGIDFAEDDLDLLAPDEIATQAAGIVASLEALAATYGYGRLVREGLTLAIVGRPNAGKSSLFNRLLERERAIVTAQPGTTRDVVSEQLVLGGIPVELLDTAGLREAEGEAERLGIARSREALAEADFVLVVVDATLSLDAEDVATVRELAGRPHLVVWNKCDLIGDRAASSPVSESRPLGELRAGDGAPSFGGLPASARTGAGIEELKAAILERLAVTPATDAAVLTNLRQHEAIAEALEAVRKALAAATAQLPHELLLLDLHAGLEALDRLTGATSTDDILALIFSQFCIGK